MLSEYMCETEVCSTLFLGELWYGILLKQNSINVKCPLLTHSSGAKGSGGMDMCADKLMTG